MTFLQSIVIAFFYIVKIISPMQEEAMSIEYLFQIRDYIQLKFIWLHKMFLYPLCKKVVIQI